MFFMMAAAWGFAIGGAAVAWLLRGSAGEPAGRGLEEVAVLAGGGVIAVLGALLIAGAYRSRRRRH